jgi:uncharacterized protein (TIGR02118 family)
MGLAEVIDDDVECGEEGVHVEHESVPFPTGWGGKLTLRRGHLPLKSSPPISHQAFKRYEAARVVATPDGSEPPYYRIFEGYFEDIEQLQSGMATPEGEAPPNDVPNFATGGVTIFISEIDT